MEDQPHFLYQSSFRESPDLQYESDVSGALESLAQNVLAQSQGNDESEERIWQIASDDMMRGADSREFEARNGEWKYTVRLHQAL